VFVVSYVLLGREVCGDGLISRLEESSECGVSECDRESSTSLRPFVAVKPLGFGGRRGWRGEIPASS